MNSSHPGGRTVQVQGLTVYFEERGDREPLVLLHGLTGTSADWAHLFDLDALSRRFRVIAPDARGHGRSTNPGGAFSLRQCAADLLALLDQLGVERFRALGVSLGAKTLLHVATRAPERVAAMILVSAAPYFPEQARRAMRAAATGTHSPEEWELMRARHPGGDEQIQALWALPGSLADRVDDLNFTPPYLSTIRARTLVVGGDRDPLYPVELSVDLARSIPRSSLWILPGAGHAPVFGEAREQFVRTALDFLEEAPGVAGATGLLGSSA